MATISSVLVIDDDELARQSLVDIFKDEGVSHIRAVASAEEALKVVAEEPFAVIVCDFKLPGMNGLSFMGKLRLKGVATPLLLISGLPDKAPVIAAAAGLNTQFLPKPFTPTELLEAIDCVIDGSR